MATEGVGSEIVPDNKEMVLKYSTKTKNEDCPFKTEIEIHFSIMRV